MKSRSQKRFPDHVRLLVLDFDGVMTDNRVWVGEDGRESVAVNRADGLGLARLSKSGVEVLVLSTEENRVVEARCRKLGLQFAQGVSDKRAVLARWIEDRNLRPEQVVYVGNDVNDAACFELAGTSVAVADAWPELLERADWVLARKGGYGAVREVCDLILGARAAKEAHAAND